MAKPNTFVCSSCGASFSKWSGRCEACGEWNSIAEETPLSAGPSSKSLGAKRGSAVTLTDLSTQETPPPRAISGLEELDRVLGGGLVAGSAILVGGDPGIGKSTLLLQAAAAFAHKGLKTVYVSGEEATAQVRLRAQRLGLAKAPVRLAAETNLRNILTTLESEKPQLVIIDSIQTMWADNVDSAPGSVTQVRATAHELTSFAKRHNVSVIMVGHVTKEGQIAGPRVVEHMVDTVLYFEGERGHQFRILRAVKNRFGPADEIGVFEMTGSGLAEVLNPSALFLSERGQPSAGSVVFAGIEGTRPVLVELQALVAPSPHSHAPPGGGRLGWGAAVDDPRRARGTLRHPLRGTRCLPKRRRRAENQRTGGRPGRRRRASERTRRCGFTARDGGFRGNQPLRCAATSLADRKQVERSPKTWFHRSNRSGRRQNRIGRRPQADPACRPDWICRRNLRGRIAHR